MPSKARISSKALQNLRRGHAARSGTEVLTWPASIGAGKNCHMRSDEVFPGCVLATFRRRRDALRFRMFPIV
jgi:hypothetical protein